MKKYAILIILIIVLLIKYFYPVIVFSEDIPTKSKIQAKSLFKALKSPNKARSDNATEEFKKIRKNILINCIAIVKGFDPKTSQCQFDPSVYNAILLLGEFRAVEAVPVLSGNITILIRYLKDNNGIKMRMGPPYLPWTFGINNDELSYNKICEVFPVVRSLIQIGNPVIPYLFKIIEETKEDEIKIQLIAFTIVKILGRAALPAIEYEMTNNNLQKNKGFQACIRYMKQYINIEKKSNQK